MKYSILVLALLALVSADDSVLLEFDPAPKLIMDTASGNFSVRMLKPPSENAPATVYFTQPGFQFSKCQLTFTNLNYNVSQEVEIVAAPAFSKQAKAESIVASICAPDTEYNALNQTYDVEPKILAGKVASSTGDPHYLTFDGKKFDFMKVGAYYLFQSEQLNMQSHTRVIDGNAKVSWNDKFAIRYGSTAYVVALNGTKLETSLVSPDQDDNELEVVETDKNQKAYEFVIGDGTGKVIVTTGGKYLDITVTLSPERYPGAKGLLTGDQNPCPAEDDMFKGNCQIPAVKFQNPLHTCGVIADVPKCEAYVAPVTDTAPVAEMPKITPYKQRPLKQGTRKVTISVKYDANKVYPKPVYKQKEPVDMEVATTRCDTMIRDQRMSEIDRAFYVESCAFDYANSGDVQDVEQYRKTYNGECGAVLDFKETESKSNGNEKEDEKGGKEHEPGLGLENECKEGQCGANGYCSGSGCSCNDGFMGDRCEVPVEAPEQIKVESGSVITAVSFVAATVSFLFVI